ncbi:MAG TPA: hypothetical protein VF112_08100, partial [Candidatus Dormibacteraeota bacterium]
MVAVSVEYVPPDDDLPQDGDLDELLDLAAELSAPEELPDAWDRRARFSGGLMSRLLRGGGRGEEDGVPEEDDEDADLEMSAELVRLQIDEAVAELGELALVPEAPARRQLPAIVYPRQWIPIPWRRPLAVSGGLLLVGVVGGILFHTLGPDSYNSLPFTQPQALLGPAPAEGDIGRFPTLAALPPPVVTARPPRRRPRAPAAPRAARRPTTCSSRRSPTGRSSAAVAVAAAPAASTPSRGRRRSRTRPRRPRRARRSRRGR